MEPVDREGSSGSEASDVRRSPRIVVPQDSTMLGRNEEFFDDRLEYEECITRPFFPAEAFALATVSLTGDPASPSRPTSPRRARRKRDIARPFVEKGLVSGLIYMLGEAIARGLFFDGSRWGVFPSALWHQTVLHSTLVGMFANGPLLHFFFEFMDKFITVQSRFWNIVIKVVIDQVVWGCVWNSAYIFLMNLATDSPGFGYIGEGLGSDFLIDLVQGVQSAFAKAVDPGNHAILLTEGLKMLPLDIICYSIIPLRFRALWVVACDVFWVTILSKYD